MRNYQPLVSVNVLMYNSSKYIIETLESVKSQTYQNIELIMSDDKSTDNTVQICEEWISKNKDRFVSYKIVVPDHNTGQSGNYNRAFRAATGEWIKEIDGDDLLLPNCLTDLVDFVAEKPEAKYVFGEMGFFGGNKSQIKSIKNLFDYSIFNLSPTEQLDRLLNKGNCIPSPCSFYSKAYIDEIGFECDERIPYLEDWPKWINLIRKNVIFYPFHKKIALYRVSGGISTGRKAGYKYFETMALFKRYYIYPEWQKKGEDYFYDQIIKEQCNMYREILDYDRNLRKYMDFPPIKFLRILFSWRYKIARKDK